jgi:hypothetical protein
LPSMSTPGFHYFHKLQAQQRASWSHSAFTDKCSSF